MNGTGTTRKWKWNLRRYLVAGVLVWLPILATVWVVNAILHLMDLTLRVLPPAFRPEALVGFPLPGVGALFALIVLLLTGLLVTNLIGGGSSSGARTCSTASRWCAPCMAASRA